MISSRLANGLLIVIVLVSLAAVALQSPLNPGEEGAMFSDVVLEQQAAAAQPEDSGLQAGSGLLQSGVATAKAQE